MTRFLIVFFISLSLSDGCKNTKKPLHDCGLVMAVFRDFSYFWPLKTKGATMPLPIFKQFTCKVCYMILPEGIKEDLNDGLKLLSEKYSVSIVVIEAVNWNDDLTPWPAEGVFKKAKPFGGRAMAYLNKLTNKIVPETEKSLEIEKAERTILGVSLSGLFAVWSAFNTDVFPNIISISGSLWYDDIVEWMKEQTSSPQLEKVCMLLGDKEKNSKEKRMATVEERTLAAAHILKEKTCASVTFELVEGTHFSPIMPRLERAFEVVYGLGGFHHIPIGALVS